MRPRWEVHATALFPMAKGRREALGKECRAVGESHGEVLLWAQEEVGVRTVLGLKARAERQRGTPAWGLQKRGRGQGEGLEG